MFDFLFEIVTLMTFKDPLKSRFLQVTNVQTGLSWAVIDFSFSNVSMFQTWKERIQKFSQSQKD